MKKIILLVVLSTGFAFSSFAQTPGNGKFNLGFDGAFALNNMNAIFDGGIGGSLKYEYHFNKMDKRLYFTLEAGYETFFVKTKLQNAFVPSTTAYVPVKAGVKYYVVDRMYLEMQAGVSIYAQHGGGNAFDYSPGVGYSFKSGFEVGIRYENWNQTPENHITGDYGISGSFVKPADFGQLALRIAERF